MKIMIHACIKKFGYTESPHQMARIIKHNIKEINGIDVKLKPIKEVLESKYNYTNKHLKVLRTQLTKLENKRLKRGLFE